MTTNYFVKTNYRNSPPEVPLKIAFRKNSAKPLGKAPKQAIFTKSYFIKYVCLK